jgi:hypothetical protein
MAPALHVDRCQQATLALLTENSLGANSSLCENLWVIESSAEGTFFLEAWSGKL